MKRRRTRASYYHMAASYWPNGLLNVLTQILPGYRTGPTGRMERGE